MTNRFLQRDLHRVSRLALLSLAIAGALPAIAQPTTIGPFLDYAETITSLQGPGRTTKTKLDVEGQITVIAWANNGGSGFEQVFSPYLPLTPCGTSQWPTFAICGTLTFIDRVNISPVNPIPNADGIPVKGLSYISYDHSDGTGQALITTLYGRDSLNGSRLQLSGFDALQPEVRISDEQIIGNSGAVFTPSLAASVSVGDAHVALGTHFDTRMISGDPNGRLYLFQTSVPYVEISSAVPEPGTWAMLAAGLAALALGARRRRSAIGSTVTATAS